MDDLSATLQSVLSDPQSMAQIQSIMGALGLNNAPAPTAPATPVAPPAPTVSTAPLPVTQAAPAVPAAPAPAPAPNLDMLSALLPAANGASNPILPLLMRVAPLLTAANEEDDATRLLAALRPLLGEERRKKLDEAARILKLLRLLPLLRETGILQNIL